ncbi:HNH endonuclease [bacterium]|nr:HNH endonuclease [bacterium]MDC1257340.1 HNH endonuclease [bacterium]
MPSQQVLLLNADAQPVSYLPLSTIGWQTAVKSYFSDKVKILHNYPDIVLHSANFEMPCPSVIMLNRFQRQPKSAKFTRKNLFIRDNFHCQYCEKQFSYSELTIDHVVPRVLGGANTWLNTVASCQKCNTDKGHKLVKPKKVPTRPSWFSINNLAKTYDLKIPDHNWQQYLDWPEHLLHIVPPKGL